MIGIWVIFPLTYVYISYPYFRIMYHRLDTYWLSLLRIAVYLRPLVGGLGVRVTQLHAMNNYV